MGLSPRMRGNRHVQWQNHCKKGSIPAHAGKPLPSDDKQLHYWVYPRACGETTDSITMPERGQGLSPRMRGNLCILDTFGSLDGSIPAHAGKPTQASFFAIIRWVYPRACGETGRTGCGGQRSRGLSPRMRGNLRAALRPPCRPGSIPAHAGKPAGHYRQRRE